MERKITIIGDIMCEPLLLKASRRKRDQYDFSPVFSNVRQLFAESDYVIGNLETPLAGKKAKYVNELFKFNAPDAFADAIKDAGIDMVMTANNHCLDRGIAGLNRTINVLNEAGIAHTGTSLPQEERNEPAYIEIDGCRIAVINYTYGTNYYVNNCNVSENEIKQINLLYPITETISGTLKNPNRKPSKIKQKVKSLIKKEHIIAIKRFLGKKKSIGHADDYYYADKAEPYMLQMEKDIRIAKENADIVLCCPHIGGQFNLIPGQFSEMVLRRAMQAGCDAVIASHPHVVQKAISCNGIPCFYSIGNFSMSPNTSFLPYEKLPNFGLAVHLYLDEKKINRITFSILKIVEKARKQLTVYPVDELYAMLDTHEKRELEEQVAQVYEIVTQKPLIENIIQREYSLIFAQYS